MADGKKFYWIKVKDSFMTSDKVDFLMSQKDGSNYVVLYQMLCLKCINTNGELSRTIGEIIIPFDVDKITRDCKYFSRDTVVIALELFKKLGMIYQEENGCLRISDFENMVGSETDWAERKRIQRQNKKNISDNGQNMDNVGGQCPLDIRDKRLDIRDINLNTHTNLLTKDINTNNQTENTKIVSVNKDFSKPQQNYAKVIYDLFLQNDLPCWSNFTEFIMSDFKDALMIIHNYHSDDVIQACKNYIKVLRDPNFWPTAELRFDSLVRSQNFKDYLPQNFKEERFLIRQNQNKDVAAKKNLQDKIQLEV